MPEDPADAVIAEFNRIRNNTGGIKTYALRSDMQQTMTTNVGVFRTDETLSDGLDRIRKLRTQFAEIEIDDKGDQFNTDLLEAWELGCLLELAEVTTISALARTESQGCACSG